MEVGILYYLKMLKKYEINSKNTMIVKTNKKTSDGRDIYVNVFTSTEGPLSVQFFQPSQRKRIRQETKGTETYSKIVKRILQVEANRQQKLKKLKKQLSDK
jgi:hypothetical protein